MKDCLRFEMVKKNIALVTMDRKDVHNAYNKAMVDAFARVIDETEQNPDIACVILTGAGEKSFCSGADLGEVMKDNGQSLRSAAGGYQPLQHIKRKKIWIAAVNGLALGGGFELALSCDFIFAAETAYFGLPEVNYGLLPVGGGMQTLSESVPKAIVKEIVIGGKRLSSSEALQWGIINKITSQSDVIDVAVSFADDLNKKSLPAVLAANDLINQRYKISDTDWQSLSEDYLRQLQRITNNELMMGK